MIGVDWGTSSFRAFRVDAAGTVRERREAPLGILHVEAGRFAEALRAEIGPWLANGEDRVLLAGMVGSRQGWQEAAYLPCPAGAAELARALADVPFAGARVKLVPGLSDADSAGVPEVMRGEETQLVGALARIGSNGLVCLPGSHSKWARIGEGRIAGYATHLTGEAYAALRGHTILGRMMRDGPTDLAAFDVGAARAADPGGLLHHLFGVRTLGLFGALSESAAASYLSGLLIGHEVRAAMPARAEVHLIGAPELCALYARTIAAAGGRAIEHDADAAARGLALLGGARAMELKDWLDRCPLVAILRGVRPDEAVAIGAALEAAGIAIIEVPLNSPQPLDSIARLADRFGERLLVGAGTVLRPDKVAEVAAAGGRLIVTPHADPAITRAARHNGLIAVPGFFTPAEAFALLDAGADALKLFPAEAANPAVLKALLAVLPADVAILPVGGIGADNIRPWIAAGAAGFGIGSAIYRPGDTPDAVAAKARRLVAALAQ